MKTGGTFWSSFSICDQSVCSQGPSLHPWRAHESQTTENGDQVQTEEGELCRQKFIIHNEFSFSSSSPPASLSSYQWSLVCGTSERATAAGINLVRRSAWLQAKEYGATGPKISSHDHVKQTHLWQLWSKAALSMFINDFDLILSGCGGFQNWTPFPFLLPLLHLLSMCASFKGDRRAP